MININNILEPDSMVPQPQSLESSQIGEDSSRTCPLCSSKIRYFLVNFHEKMLSCENPNCEFPFGYEDLLFQRYQIGEDISDNGSIRTRHSSLYPRSSSVLSSTSSWWEIEKIDKLNKAITEDSQGNSPNKPKISKKSEYKKSLDVVKSLNEELKELTETKYTDVQLCNKAWLGQLKSIQDKSGYQLLKVEEQKKVEYSGNDNLKIDINNEDNNSIKISITHVKAESMG